MSDEPSLPHIPPSKANNNGLFGPARKRVRLDLPGQAGTGGASLTLPLLTNSSDPAVFSSDDDPGLDNYGPSSRRKKKRYVGAWFAQHPASADSLFGDEASGEAMQIDATGTTSAASISVTEMAPPMAPRKRILSRQMDSGVWLGETGNPEEPDDPKDEEGEDETAANKSPGSTSSQLSLAPVVVAPPPPAHPKFAPLPPPQRHRRILQRVPSLAVDQAEEEARRIIQDCIEAGNQEVELMGLGLTTLSDATVEPLSRLEPFPVVAADVEFEQPEPRLHVYLSSNSLQRLPAALFQLDHLRILSLRSNGLRSLPPAIGQLRSLTHLNVSLNALTSLPIELLRLCEDDEEAQRQRGGQPLELLLYPNPLFEPEGRGDGDGDEEDGGEKEETNPNENQLDRPNGDTETQTETPPKAVLVARSPVHYLDSRGRSCSRFCLQPDVGGRMATEDLHVAPCPPSFSSSSSSSSNRRSPSHTPSLMELALATCYASPQLPVLPDLLPADAPPSLRQQLVRARLRKEEGGARCGVCSRKAPLVQPVTEWIEWWRMGAERSKSSGRPVPFLVQGCSWGCVPKAVRDGRTTMETRQDEGGDGGDMEDLQEEANSNNNETGPKTSLNGNATT